MSRGVLQANDICKTYHLGGRELQVLRGVDLDLSQGEFVALQGASGSGKSTLLQLLGGLDQPTSGTILFMGDPLRLQTAQQAAFAAIKPGAEFLAPHWAAMKTLAYGLEELNLLPCSAEESLKPENQFYKRYTLHGTSHMLGMDVHDCSHARAHAYRNGKLEEGMLYINRVRKNKKKTNNTPLRVFSNFKRTRFHTLFGPPWHLRLLYSGDFEIIKPRTSSTFGCCPGYHHKFKY